MVVGEGYHEGRQMGMRNSQALCGVSLARIHISGLAKAVVEGPLTRTHIGQPIGPKHQKKSLQNNDKAYFARRKYWSNS